MTIRVLHRGHSRVEFIMSSEHTLHMAMCLRDKINAVRTAENREHLPAIDNGDICFFILTNDTKGVSLEICGHRGPFVKSGYRLGNS